MNTSINNKISTKSQSRSILIIEDSLLFNNALKKGLTAIGYQITSAFTLKEALPILQNSTFNLIILDLHLPDGEGEFLLKHLNAVQKQKIMIYTSNDDKGRRDK